MNKNDAAAAIGISVRSLQRDTQKGLIKAEHNFDLNRRLNVDYSFKEVERWKKERRRVVPESVAIATRENGAADRQLAAIWSEDRFDKFIASMKEMVNGSKKPSTVDLKDKMVLSLPEAVKLSGIPRERLRTALLPDNTVLCFKDDPRLGRGYKIRKIDLVEYIHALDLPEMEQHEK
jgi:hypothetical protein